MKSVSNIYNKINNQDDDDDEYVGLYYNGIRIDQSSDFSKKEDKEQKKNNCFHNWKKYVGFTEVYYFCEYCDKKSNHDYESAQKPWLK